MNAPTEKIATDVRVLVSDVEELLKATATQSGERIAAARARLESALTQARDTVAAQARDTADVTDRYVRENPWKATAISAAVGLVVGFLLSRR